MAKHWDKSKLHPLSMEFHVAVQWEALVFHMTCEKLAIKHEDSIPEESQDAAGKTQRNSVGSRRGG